MKVRRKSLWRSRNNRHAKFRANQRAAKECKRLARVAREEPMPATAHCVMPPRLGPLFVVTVRCRDGARVRLPIHELPNGLSISPTLAGRKIAAILANYRPTVALGEILKLATI